MNPKIKLKNLTRCPDHPEAVASQWVGIKSRPSLIGALFSVLLLFSPQAVLHAQTSSPRPNIVFILADDVGWRDLGCYGTRFYETPNIDRLAERGVRFVNAYAANPFCSPTRASILTGLYPARIGLTSASGHAEGVNLQKQLFPSRPPRYRLITPRPITRLDTSYLTMAEAFKREGYATAHIGKWHLGSEPYSPLQQGYDRDIPHTSAAFPPLPDPPVSNKYSGGGGYINSPLISRSGLPVRANEHLEDRMAEEAANWIRSNRSRPFFLSYWAFSAHGPHGGKADYINAFQDKSQADEPQRNPVYAAMVKSLDDAVGRIIETLDNLNLTNQTIIVFTSDNGGQISPIKKVKANQPWYQIPVTSNDPLRGGKGSIWEGGTRVPAIISYPGTVPTNKVSAALLSSVDYYPTLVALCGLRLPDLKLDGVSQRRALLKASISPSKQLVSAKVPPKNSPRTEIYNIYAHGEQPAASVRVGDLKLVRFFCRNKDFSDHFEMYDLSKDPGEKVNIFPDSQQGESLQDKLSIWLEHTGAILPIRNPQWNGAGPTADGEHDNQEP